MSDRYEFQAYIATLITLAVVFISALLASAMFPQIEGKMEVFGLGTITGGLIGILRSPFSSVGKTGAAVGSADNVNVTPAA